MQDGHQIHTLETGSTLATPSGSDRLVPKTASDLDILEKKSSVDLFMATCPGF
jgi:hypothetical protein